MKVYKTLPDGTEIVEYEDSLAQAVADMWNKSGEGWGGSFDSGVYTAERVISKRKSGAFFNVYIAIKDGEALGYCSLDRYYKDENTAYVHLLNVRPDYHGKGIGRELVLMCVNETINRGMPRIDIHTWPGNTKAVPMYKKCGYFWEDRTDTTHLSNYIPTVLSTEPIKEFFENADWYTDSTRKIELKPDGKKVNKFELYEYEWEKDGKQLRVGFEKTGRRINLIDTNDYRIVMTAENHELAYGLSYPCSFLVKNKTGKDLNVSITAKSDDVIDFEGSWSGVVTDEKTFNGEFFVNAIDEAQDDMRMHPCVLADVSINGKTAEFGLGIEPKFPVLVSLGRKQRIAKPSMTEKLYINIKNGLPSDATVRFSLPENSLLDFSQREYEVKLTGGKDVSVSTTARLLDCGYAGIPVKYEIRMDNSEVIIITRPLHIINQGLIGAFGFETEEFYGTANGLWRLKLDKKDNEVTFDKLIASGQCEFFIPELGKPYDEEFNIMKPSDVRVTQDGAYIRFEADYISGKFTGAILTEIYEFDSAGTLKRRHRVTNKGSARLDLSLKSELWTNVGRRPIFPYDGEIHEVADKMNYGFDTIEKEKLDENWVFDESGGSPSGVYWPPQYSPDVTWGDVLKFEFPIGELSPEQSFETDPIVYMCDVFKNFRDFRNYVLGIHEESKPIPHNHMELIVNGNNPVVSADTLELILRNNRQNIRDGTVSVSSPDGTFPSETQTNPDEELRPENTFRVPITPGHSGINLADLSFRLSGYEQKTRRALLITDDTVLKTEERDNIFTVENGKLRFSATPSFSDAAYSLQYGDNEWFFSNYPSTESYSWWNPFVGGIKSYPVPMGNSLVLREKINASFTSETDRLGNVWTGIKVDVTVEKYDHFKGLCYTHFYMTLPGVPVLCHFTKLVNNTGRYMDMELCSLVFFSGKETLSEIGAVLKEGNLECKVSLGGVEDSLRYDRLVTISRNGDDLRPEKLYVFKDSERDNGKQHFEYDINIAYSEINAKGKVADGENFTTKPVFCILTEKELAEEDLDDLRRISF